MNISVRITKMAMDFPKKRSVVFSERQKDGSYKYPFYTFEQFEGRSNQMSNYFTRIGITSGMRVLLFVKPCLDFSVITFALFKMGAIPVLIDPGMGLKNLLSSIHKVRPDALISIGKVHWLRRIERKSFKSIRINISLDKVNLRNSSTHYLYQDLHKEYANFVASEVKDTDHAAILFTSGGTGIPKGVVYTHGILNAQTEALRDMFSLNQDMIDLPGFPLFSLFTLAMGMTSVIPDMDPTKPGACDPKKILRNILDQGPSFLAGSPIIWQRLGEYCFKNNIQLGSVKHVVMFGAPVRLELHQMYKKILPFGDTYTPYGATEFLPVSLISGSEILKTKMAATLSGEGTCIGRAIKGVDIRLIKVSDIPEMGLNIVPKSDVGEIVVTGRQVTPEYFEMPEETKKAKIFALGKLWHRMGDIGRFDEEGNLWFLGRKAHRVELNTETTLYPIPVESIFNQHPAIRRTALVKLTRRQEIAPGLVIERHDGETNWTAEFLNEVRELSRRTNAAGAVREFFLHRSFPVDVRHNIKIDRTKLALWAQTKVGKECLGKPNIIS